MVTLDDLDRWRTLVRRAADRLGSEPLEDLANEMDEAWLDGIRAEVRKSPAGAGLLCSDCRRRCAATLNPSLAEEYAP